MARFKLLLEYDGTRYAGWQVQQNARTVQGELLQAAFQIFGTQQLELYGAGRTDAGVHARGQVAHLDLPEAPAGRRPDGGKFARQHTATPRLEPEQIMIRFNDLLPHDITILKVEKAHPRFHARHDARSRAYTYQISKRRDAFGKKYVWWVRDRLDVGAMRAAAAALVGFHDFQSFGERSTDLPDQSTTVELTRAEVREDADRIYIHLVGSHFLWKMVRRIVGVLVEVGRGNMSPDTVEGLLKKPSREPARFTAPPSGLFLENVTY